MTKDLKKGSMNPSKSKTMKKKEVLNYLKKFNIDKPCKDFRYGCFNCQWYMALEIIEDWFNVEDEN